MRATSPVIRAVLPLGRQRALDICVVPDPFGSGCGSETRLSLDCRHGHPAVLMLYPAATKV